MSVEDYFIHTNQFMVKQQIDIMEVLVGYEQQNRYVIMDMSRGVPVCYAVEESDVCERMWCSHHRSFCMQFITPQGNPLMRMMSPNTCTFGFQAIAVEAPPGNPIGTIDAPGCCFSFTPTFVIRNSAGQARYTIPSGCGAWLQLCPFQNFPVNDMEGTQVANIGKIFMGIIQESFTSADTFGVTFMANLPPLDKALIISAVIKIDFEFYENNQSQGHYQGGMHFSMQ